MLSRVRTPDPVGPDKENPRPTPLPGKINILQVSPFLLPTLAFVWPLGPNMALKICKMTTTSPKMHPNPCPRWPSKPQKWPYKPPRWLPRLPKWPFQPLKMALESSFHCKVSSPEPSKNQRKINILQASPFLLPTLAFVWPLGPNMALKMCKMTTTSPKMHPESCPRWPSKP